MPKKKVPTWALLWFFTTIPYEIALNIRMTVWTSLWVYITAYLCGGVMYYRGYRDNKK